MSRTDVGRSSRAVLAVLAGLVMQLGGAVSSPVHGQTIAEVAERQRAKLRDEVAPAPQATAQAIAPAPKPTPSPWKLHGVYAVGQKVSAELTKGDQLYRVQAGSTFAGLRVLDVTLGSITIERERGCGRKCALIVPLGGTF